MMIEALKGYTLLALKNIDLGDDAIVRIIDSLDVQFLEMDLTSSMTFYVSSERKDLELTRPGAENENIILYGIKGFLLKAMLDTNLDEDNIFAALAEMEKQLEVVEYVDAIQYYRYNIVEAEQFNLITKHKLRNYS